MMIYRGVSCILLLLNIIILNNYAFIFTVIIKLIITFKVT